MLETRCLLLSFFFFFISFLHFNESRVHVPGTELVRAFFPHPLSSSLASATRRTLFHPSTTPFRRREIARSYPFLFYSFFTMQLLSGTAEMFSGHGSAHCVYPRYFFLFLTGEGSVCYVDRENKDYDAFHSFLFRGTYAIFHEYLDIWSFETALINVTKIE